MHSNRKQYSSNRNKGRFLSHKLFRKKISKQNYWAGEIVEYSSSNTFERGYLRISNNAKCVLHTLTNGCWEDPCFWNYPGTKRRANKLQQSFIFLEWEHANKGQIN